MDASFLGKPKSVPTVEYAPGRWADVYGEPEQPTVLLWHGMQTDARGAVRPLAELLAGHGVQVIAPDWNSHAEDGGRADLLGSLTLARQGADDGIVLVGWSLGGAAAAGVTLDAARHDVVVAHTVCLAGAFTAADPISGRHLEELLSADIGAPFTLLHGSADDVVPVAASREFAASLSAIGWPVEVVELAADHGSIAGAQYDPIADRYEPANDALGPAREVASRIAAVVSRPGL